MRELYAKNPVNAVRYRTDKHFADYGNEYYYGGFIVRYAYVHESDDFCSKSVCPGCRIRA